MTRGSDVYTTLVMSNYFLCQSRAEKYHLLHLLKKYLLNRPVYFNKKKKLVHTFEDTLLIHEPVVKQKLIAIIKGFNKQEMEATN